LEQAGNERNSDLFKIASIFHFVLGGFQMLLSLIGVLYVVLGVMMASGALEPSKSGAPPEIMGWVFGGVGAFVTLLFIGAGILTITAGRNLASRRRRTFCIVVDAILCLMVPFGTIVGIFGLILLLKPETEKLFTG